MFSKHGIYNAIRRAFLRIGTVRLGRALIGVDRESLQSLHRRRHLVDQAEMQPSNAEIRQAVAELRSYSDSLLDDIGINRGDIEHAVRAGRFDSRVNRAAA